MAERVVRPAVDEHIEASVDLRQVLPAPLPQENGPRQGALNCGLRWPSADDDEADARQGGDVSEQVEALLRRQPSDVANNDLPAGGKLGPHMRAAFRRIEPAAIHAAGPDLDPLDPVAP